MAKLDLSYECLLEICEELYRIYPDLRNVPVDSPATLAIMLEYALRTKELSSECEVSRDRNV